MTSLVRLDLEQALRDRVQAPPGMEYLRALSAEGDGRHPVLTLLRRNESLVPWLAMVASAGAAGAGPSAGGLRELCEGLPATELRCVLALAAVLAGYAAPLPQTRFDRLGFWEHCAATAALSQALALELGEPPLPAFVAGFLHDLGRIVLDAHFPREFQAVLSYRERHDVWIGDAEVAVLGFDHTAVGGRVATAWGFPQLLIEAIAYHHRPERSPKRSAVTGIVHVADVVVRGLQLGNPGDDTIPLLDEAVMLELGMDWGTLEPALDRIDVEFPWLRQSLHDGLAARGWSHCVG